MKKIIVFIICHTFFCKFSYSQEYFEYKNPTFSFSIPEGWQDYKGTPTLLIYDKFVKVNNGIIGGILRVGQDIYLGNLETIWNLDPDAEKKELEKEAILKNYSFKKEVINGLKTAKINFETTLGGNANGKDFKAVIYKFLVVQDKHEYIIFFFLITDQKDFEKDQKDLLSIISTLNLTASKQKFNIKKVIEFKGKKYIIPMPLEYDYFSNSVFKDMKINEFTKTYCFTEELSIYDFELLIPKKLTEQPIIHFYTSKNLIEQSVTNEDFIEYKSFWKKMYEQENYNKLLKQVLLDSLIFCNYIFSETKPMSYLHLKETDNQLSTLVFINGNVGGKQIRKISITNYIFIDNLVIFIKLSQDYNTFSTIETIQNKSNSIVSEFLKYNSK